MKLKDIQVIHNLQINALNTMSEQNILKPSLNEIHENITEKLSSDTNEKSNRQVKNRIYK